MEKKLYLFTARDMNFVPCFSFLIEKQCIPKNLDVIMLHDRLTNSAKVLSNDVHVLSFDTSIEAALSKLSLEPRHTIYYVSLDSDIKGAINELKSKLFRESEEKVCLIPRKVNSSITVSKLLHELRHFLNNSFNIYSMNVLNISCLMQ